MKIYLYYWYHHYMPIKEKQEIERVFEKKDFNKFIELYKIYNIKAIKEGYYDKELDTWFANIYLPSEIIVYDTVTGEYEPNEYILSKSAFMKITEIECGSGYIQ